MGESGGSAERRAEEMRRRGSRTAGAWAAGADGERRVAAALATLPADWLVLHDRLLMPGLAESNLDHLLVGPHGIILIDAKNWAGHLGEWNGSVYQHSMTQGGFRQHRPVDRQFAGVRSMAREVARRTGFRVMNVICLAGRQAEDFGDPRVINGVWVVPLGRLVDFLTSLPPVPIADRQRLDTHVMTEFPSTTTDAALLVAMGHAIDPYSGVATRRSRGRGAPSRRPVPVRPPQQVPVASPGGRKKPRTRRGVARPLASLALITALLVSLYTGAFAAATSAVGSFFAAYVSSTVLSKGLGGGEPSSAALDTSSCESVDLSAHKVIAAADLSATPTLQGCRWSTPARSGASPAVVLVVEDRVVDVTLPAFLRSAKDKVPVATTDVALSGWMTRTVVAKGASVTSGKKKVPALRPVSVDVAHEALGLTEKQGRALGLAIAGTVSTRRVTSAP